MKTQAITPKGIFHIQVVGTEVYRLSHHKLPTRIVAGELALVEAIGTRLEKEDETEIEIAALDGGIIRLSRDTRHGVLGWRGSRYLSGQWGEWYLFFSRLHDAIDVTGKNYDKVIQEARWAF